MKMIKGGEKKRTGNGFFSKMIDNKDNKREAVKQINILNQRNLLNEFTLLNHHQCLRGTFESISFLFTFIKFNK